VCCSVCVLHGAAATRCVAVCVCCMVLQRQGVLQCVCVAVVLQRQGVLQCVCVAVVLQRQGVLQCVCCSGAAATRCVAV